MRPTAIWACLFSESSFDQVPLSVNGNQGLLDISVSLGSDRQTRDVGPHDSVRGD